MVQVARVVRDRCLDALGHNLPASIEPPSAYLVSIARADAAEEPLLVEFTGITMSQQEAAIGAFPGGKRFMLAAH